MELTKVFEKNSVLNKIKLSDKELKEVSEFSQFLLNGLNESNIVKVATMDPITGLDLKRML